MYFISFLLKGLKLTIWFNLGCVNEKLSDFGRANNYYKKIGTDNMYYVDAYVRLANLEIKRGNYPKALLICDESIKILKQAPGNV